MNKVKYIVIVLIAAIVIGGVMYFSQDTLNTKTKVIYEPQPGQQCTYSETEGNIAITSGEGVLIIDKKGKELYNIQKSFATPILSERNGYKLLYESGGTTLTYAKNDKTPCEIETDLPIINAKINSTGYIAVASMETGYKGKLVVYNDKGEETYKWQIGNSYVVDMDVSSDGKRLSVALLSMSGETVATRVVMINLDKAEIISDNILDNTIPYSVDFTRSNIAVVVTDTGVTAMDKAGKEKWSYSFDGKIVNSYKLCENGSAVFDFYGASNNSLIELYNSSGKKSGEYVSQNAIVAIDANESTVAVTDGHFIKALSWNGGDKGVIKSQNDLRALVVLDGDTIAAVGNNSVETVKY